MEDALKKLDKLTQEEARMATAEVLRATHTINEGVRVVKEQVLAIDDKVTEVIDGTQIILSQGWEMFNIDCLDGKEAKGVMKQIERPSFNPINAD